ncbi:MAG: OsmC family protein [Acidimicrobiales bacterium]
METSATPELSDDERVAPFFDPDTKRMAIRTVRGTNDATARTEISVKDFPVFATDEPKTSGGSETGPTPMEMLLASLVGCECVMIHNVASAMNFDYEGVELEASGTVDLRGPKGVPGIRPYFDTVDLKVTIYTSEPRERMEQLARNAEARCPVMNLMRDAGAAVNAEWQIR